MNRNTGQASDDFKSLSVRSFYSTTGHRILNEALSPILSLSTNYDRLTGYFTVESLASVAAGLEAIYRKSGKMRLVIGIHDVPGDLLAARALGSLLPETLVDQVKEKFFVEVGQLSDMTSKSAIAGIAWMLRLGLLEVRVASPKSQQGIYHQKRMIFKDSNGNVIAGTGSLNETIGGLYNVEEMQFSFSWKSAENPTLELVDSFEQIWKGLEPDIDIIPLDEAFARGILEKLGNPANPFENSSTLRTAKNIDFTSLIELIRTSSSFTPFNLSFASLYPHQERVFHESLSRWPVRVMLADEVGLGKTLEAGILISYMLRMKLVENVTILCPAGLLRQWQEEMDRHFKLDFWIYQSGSKSFVSSNSEHVSSMSSNAKSSSPKLKLVSAQWARLNENEFKKLLPEMLIVDEAHAARVNVDQYGSKSTRLWKLLDSVKELVPHILLLTATPMQVHPSEYHGLLNLLGLPGQWKKFSKYEESLKIVSTQSNSIGLNEAKTMADLLLSTFESYSWLPELLTSKESLLIMELRQSQSQSSAASAILIQNQLEAFRKILTKVHPGHFLTCRNTKTGLEKFGYKFPVRKFDAPEITMSGKLEKYEWAVENYLSQAYGKTEESLKPGGKFPIGFAKSGFYQRLVSSLFASRASLLKRKAKLSLIGEALKDSNSELLINLLSDFDFEDEDLNTDDFGQLAPEIDFQNGLSKVLENVKQAIILENSYIEELLRILDGVGENIENHDPKFSVAMKSLEKFLAEGPVLVFSRYTDTLDGFLNLFCNSHLLNKVPGFALYTGGKAWIQTSMGVVPATKSDVTDALNSGVISLVFCSDAASEGLNLQTAKTLINLDVPWNPARLEQRIGRIARLGQKSPEVNIINLWYPDSIEAIMYVRLLSRQEDYQLAVGEAADIFADAIRNEVRNKFAGEQVSTKSEYLELQRVREDYQRIALEKIWQSDGDFPASTNLRVDLLEFIRLSDSELNTSRYSSELTAEPGTPKSFTLLHPAFDEIGELLTSVENLGNSGLCLVLDDKKLLAFCTHDQSGRLRLLNIMSLGRILQSISGKFTLEESDFSGDSFEESHLSIHLRNFLLEQSNIPNHSYASVPFEGIFAPWSEQRFINLEVQELCKVNVES
ncbi:helicase [Candidatus Planktophila versatilis]|uniref:SNF2-related protein n=1 Tax=Candidatus Planktophila versatilis TaxID=1884905 RepID=UPI000BAC94AB|nr:SNF2-related protein [Candidatus Planktophila versatilis]ASY18366.1 helicase [Candidatus Planktophila versatilis]